MAAQAASAMLTVPVASRALLSWASPILLRSSGVYEGARGLGSALPYIDRITSSLLVPLPDLLARSRRSTSSSCVCVLKKVSPRKKKREGTLRQTKPPLSQTNTNNNNNNNNPCLRMTLIVAR